MSDNEHAALRNLREGRRDAWIFPPGELRDGHYEGLVLTTDEPSCPFCGGRGTVEWYEHEHDTGASYPMDYAECRQCFTRAMFSESEGGTTFVWTIPEDDLEHFFAGQTAAYWQVHADALAKQLADAEERADRLQDALLEATERDLAAEASAARLRELATAEIAFSTALVDIVDIDHPAYPTWLDMESSRLAAVCYDHGDLATQGVDDATHDG